MSGTIRTYQKCPRCGASFQSSKGGFPIICKTGCQTQPTKFYIAVKWRGKAEALYHDRDGRSINDWGHAVAVMGDIRSRMASHKAGKGFFDPQAYKKQSSTSFQAFWDRFEKGYKGSTKDKISAIGRHHMAYFDDYQMRDIATWHIAEWWQNLADKELSVAYRNDILTWLKAFFRNAIDMDVIEKMPKFPKALYKPEPDVDEYLSSDEQLSVLNEIPEYDRPIFEFLMLTGRRVNEACALQMSDLNSSMERIVITNTVKRDGSIGVVKNKNRQRIPYTGRIKECIKQALRRSGIGNQFVFVNKWGRRYDDEYLRRQFSNACDRAGVAKVKLKNATRHSAGMRLIEAGYSLEEVRRFLGHSTQRMSRHYAKVLDKKLDEMYSLGLASKQTDDKMVIK